MADITKATLRRKVLEHLIVIAAGETPATADQTLVDDAIDAAHERLRKFGLAPFETSAIPSWAQMQLRDIVAADVAQTFGKSGQTLIEYKAAAEIGERELARQLAGHKHPIPIEVEYF